MPNVAHVLREEIQRLARKQVKAGVSPVKRETVRLRKIVADLRRQLTALSRTSQGLVTKVTALVASQETEAARAPAADLRPTSRSLGALRRRLGLTQVQSGRLLGVSGQAVRAVGEQGRSRPDAPAHARRFGGDPGNRQA